MKFLLNNRNSSELQGHQKGAEKTLLPGSVLFCLIQDTCDLQGLGVFDNGRQRDIQK